MRLTTTTKSDNFNYSGLPPMSNWYAIYTRSRCEKKIYNSLLKSNYTCFLPLVKEKRKWSDRIKTVETPLLPSYVFVKIPASRIPEIYRFPGFVKFVAKEGKPAIIREKEITILEKIIRNEFDIYPVYESNIGEKVRIIKGPFRNMFGTVSKKVNGYKVILNLDSMNQVFAVEFNNRDICKLVK